MGTYYCPNGFQVHPSDAQLCVIECPREKGYELRIKDGQPACVYKNEESVFVPLLSARALQLNANSPSRLTLEDLMNQQTFGGTVAGQIAGEMYSKAKTDFETNFATTNGKIENSQKVKDAFKALQEAENVRDVSPQAYQDARIRYYTLTKGDGWLAEEKERLARSEVDPVISKMVNTYTDLIRRINQQSDTVQIVDGVKDKLGSLRDEFEYSVGTFGKQIQELRNQIQIERKKKQEEKGETIKWFDTILNLLIVLVFIYAIFVIFRKFIANPITQNPSR